MGDHGMAYVPQAIIGARRGAPVEGALNNVQRRFLHAGCILLAGGCLVLTYTATGKRGSANAEHAVVGLALLLLGVFLILLSPVANQFPGAARVGAAVADAALFYFAPGN